MKNYFLVLLLSLVATVSQANDAGQQLFENNCSACHGSSGQGGVGVPLSLPSFIDSVSDNYLYKTILFGRPGRVMPSFSTLGETEIKNIVSYMRSWTGNPGKKFSNDLIKGSPANGKKLFSQYCVACHSEGGTGGKGTGVTFSRPRDAAIIAPALNNPGFLSSAEDQFIQQTLIHGRKGTPMMSYRKLGLSDHDINDIVSYVRSFEGGPYPYSPIETEETVLKAESPYSLEETISNLKQAIIGKNFKLIRVQELNKGLVESGKENKKHIILYFCNFNLLNRALAIDPRVGMFLPCRITVVEDQGKVTLMAINPLKMSKIFNNSELDQACRDMHGIYSELLEEASL